MPTTSHRAAGRTRGRHTRSPLQAAPEPLLEVVGVTAHAPGGRVLLDDVSFSVQRGWLVAVVGPTGAGKTSLARALTGSLALDAGTLRLDGRDLANGGRDQIAFVPQDDVLHGSLGLERTLRYAASLRVPSSVSRGERAHRVGSALTELGLQHHAEVAVASLSGGQRKRANIAAELVGQPEVLVLDEPTSGLDPGYEKSVMTTLRQLADAGRTVITVTHSMQSLQQCDRVLYLAEGGRVAYFGPPARAADYFGEADAADVFLALDTEPGQAWQERFRAHPAYARYVDPVVRAAARSIDRPTPAAAPTRRNGPTWRSQVLTLVRRQVALLRSDRRHLALLALQGPLLGLLVHLVLVGDSLAAVPGTSQLTPGGETVAMFVALSATWLGASNTVREVVKERHIVRREVDAGMAPSAYVASKGLVLGVLTMVQSAVLASVACLGQRPPLDGGWLPERVEVALIGALVGLAAACLGLLLSALVTSPDKALAVLPMTLVAELVLAGSWAATSTAPGLGWLRSLTGAHWGVTAIGGSVAGDAGTLLRAATVLVVLSATALVGTGALVRRHTRQADAAGRLRELKGAAEARAGAIVGTAALGLALIGLGTLAIGLTGRAGDPGGVVAAEAPGEVAAAPAPVEPPVATTPEPATPAAVQTPATVTTLAPTTTVTTPTTVAVPETTTSTVFVTPTTAPATTPAPSTGVNAASADAVPWWSPWYWIALAYGG